MRAIIKPQKQLLKDKIDKKLNSSPMYMTGFIKSLSDKHSTSLSTKWLYLNYILNFIEYMERNFNYKLIEMDDLNNITTEDIKVWIEDIEEYTHKNKRYASSKSTIANKISALNRFYKYISPNLKNNINVNLSRPSIQSKEIVSLSDDEVMKIMNNIKNGIGTHRAKLYQKKFVKRDIAIVSLLIGTGIRISPLVELSLSDLDMEKQCIHITSKGDVTSTHYFNDSIAKKINDYLEQRLKNNSGCDALFLSSQNKYMNVRTVELMLDKYSINISKNVTPHVFRKTFGTKVYKETGDIYLTQYLLGHKNVSTTIKHYARMDEERVKEAINIRFI